MTPILTLHNPTLAKQYYAAGYWQASTLTIRLCIRGTPSPNEHSITSIASRVQ